MLEDLDLLITGGRLVTCEGVTLSAIGVRSGRVALLGDPASIPPAKQVIDVGGCYVFPGMIDAHVHFRVYSHHADELIGAARSAAYGGITTMIGHLLPRSELARSATQLLEEFRQVGEQESLVDFSFHSWLRPDDRSLAEVPQLVAMGAPSVKVFLAYKSIGRMASDSFLLKAMEAVAAAGGIMLVHAEDGELLDHRTKVQISAGRAGP